MPWTSTAREPPEPVELRDLYLPAGAPFKELILIGAGPNGLAVAARLREQTPSALFTDDEHQRYHFVRASGKPQNGKLVRVDLLNHGNDAASKRNQKQGTKKEGEEREEREEEKKGEKDTGVATDRPAGANDELLVLDASSDSWLGTWDALFAAYRIDYLRSPMFFHPGPADQDGMLGFAHEMGRAAEVKELRGVVGKELTKHTVKKRRQRSHKKAGHGNHAAPQEIDERDRKDYANPSTPLFHDYCMSLISHYRLDAPGLIRRARVTDIVYGALHVRDPPYAGAGFLVRTDDGAVFGAKAVVLSVGPGGIPRCPRELGALERQAACHSSELARRAFLTDALRRKVQAGKNSSVLIVGGGLTSAQLADVAVREGVQTVHLLMRGPLKIKHFDVDLEWVGKFRNLQKAAFWTADTDEERLEMINSSRNGGSINPRYRKILQKHISSGRVVLHTHTRIEQQTYDAASSQWTLSLSRHSPAAALSENESADAPTTQQLRGIDYIYYATGVTPSVGSLPCLQSLRHSHPIATLHGFPCLDDDLQWREDVPLFVVGRLASLRLGPWAGNLEGGRAGAERVAWRMEELREREDWPEKWKGGAGHGRGSGEVGEWSWLGGGGGNWYDVLAEEGEGV